MLVGFHDLCPQGLSNGSEMPMLAWMFVPGLAKEAENNPFFYATRLSGVRHGCKAKLISLRFLFQLIGSSLLPVRLGPP